MHFTSFNNMLVALCALIASTHVLAQEDAWSRTPQALVTNPPPIAPPVGAADVRPSFQPAPVTNVPPMVPPIGSGDVRPASQQAHAITVTPIVTPALSEGVWSGNQKGPTTNVSPAPGSQQVPVPTITPVFSPIVSTPHPIAVAPEVTFPATKAPTEPKPKVVNGVLTAISGGSV
ncbi:hypothetical protein DFH28DRAFT_1052932 [Melampsora americana]|nr:hypothetical protein DFH28DRAFT_1052932 [Melampsora americana]